MSQQVKQAALAPLQVLIVGTQFVPNVTAVLDGKMGTQDAVLLHTRDFLSKAEHLAKVYQRYGVRPHLFEVKSAFDWHQMAEDIERLSQFLEQNFLNLTPVFNMTIGTKLMALRYAQAAQQKGWQVAYVDNKDHLLWLNPEERAMHNLEDKMTIEDYFMANGYRVLNRQKPQTTPVYALALNEIMQDIKKYQKALSQLNFYAQQAKGLKTPKIENVSPHFEPLLKILARTGGIKFNSNAQKITFKDQHAQFFANGGWLEEYIAIQINRVAGQLPKLQDHAMSVEVENLKTHTRNELDNVMLYDNKLFVVECKTKRFDHKGLPDGGSAAALYKLDTLVDVLGGVYGKGMVATVFSVSEADRKRAENYQIKIVETEQLQDFATQLTTWLMMS